MKKILLSLLMIATVAVGAIGATQAYFTDREVLGTNTLAAGRVDIDLRGTDAVHEVLLGTTQYFKGGLEPGQYSSDIFHMEVYNQGSGVSTLPVKYRITSQFLSQSVGGYWDLLWVRVRHTSSSTANPSAWPIVYQGKLKDLNINSINHAIADYLDPNITHVFYFEYGLDSSAGNVYQGANATFNILVDATQSSNPGWAQ